MVCEPPREREKGLYQWFCAEVGTALPSAVDRNSQRIRIIDPWEPSASALGRIRVFVHPVAGQAHSWVVGLHLGTATLLGGQPGLQLLAHSCLVFLGP